MKLNDEINIVRTNTRYDYTPTRLNSLYWDTFQGILTFDANTPYLSIADRSALATKVLSGLPYILVEGNVDKYGNCCTADPNLKFLIALLCQKYEEHLHNINYDPTHLQLQGTYDLPHLNEFDVYKLEWEYLNKIKDLLVLFITKEY